MNFLKDDKGNWSFVRIASMFILALFGYIVLTIADKVPSDVQIAMLICGIFPKALQKYYENKQ